MMSKMKCLNLLLMIIIERAVAVSYNQPKLCPLAIWHPNAETFAAGQTWLWYTYGIFIDTHDTIYVGSWTANSVQVWVNGQQNSAKNISAGLWSPTGLFVNTKGDIYIDNGALNRRVDKWGVNSTNGASAMSVSGSCVGLFIDPNDTIYCSMRDLHIVVKQPPHIGNSNMTITAAGNGTLGSSAVQLCFPQGIFIDLNFTMFVADFCNNRIQRFWFGDLNGTTVAGAGASSTITLNGPTGVVLDADGYLFIAECGGGRIVGSGPNGFRCVAACSGLQGLSVNQLSCAATMGFDSQGNIFVTDAWNQRVQKFLLATKSCDIAYNQPTICPNATWYANGTTLADNNTVGATPWSIFVHISGTIYVPTYYSGRILVWFQGNATPYAINTFTTSTQFSIFPTITGPIYVSENLSGFRVGEWNLNTALSSIVLHTDAACMGLFVDSNGTLYCSLSTKHKIVIKALLSSTNTTVLVAGNGLSGNASDSLNYPQGVFVDLNFTLYVADCFNNRIQRFWFGNPQGTSVAGAGAPSTIPLSYPTDLVLDTDGYLFILDGGQNRIVASGPNGFRCIVGCSALSGPAMDQLNSPQALSFDNDGNIYVADTNNSRIQKFTLDVSSCGNAISFDGMTSAEPMSTIGRTTLSSSVANASMGVFVPRSCQNASLIGPSCNVSATACDLLQPCQNLGTCTNDGTVPRGYTCLCLVGFDGEQCQLDLRVCQPNTCWNGGSCNASSNANAPCSCPNGWQGSHCETQINYCQAGLCLNGGVCRPILLNYTCECLGNSYSGRHCELVATQTRAYQIVSRSFASLAIAAMATVALFIIIIDVLKYGFGIDPIVRVAPPMKQKKRCLDIVRYVYVHGSPAVLVEFREINRT